jgi:hypothetical protein
MSAAEAIDVKPIAATAASDANQHLDGKQNL